jgi:hypothetical protein
MSKEEIVSSISLEADGDQSGNQYLFMKGGADGVSLQDTAGNPCVGVLQDKPTDTHIGSICVSGVSKVVAGAAVARFANVASDDQGRAVTAVSGDYVQGTALVAASAAGEIIPVLLRPQNQLN